MAVNQSNGLQLSSTSYLWFLCCFCICELVFGSEMATCTSHGMGDDPGGDEDGGKHFRWYWKGISVG